MRVILYTALSTALLLVLSSAVIVAAGGDHGHPDEPMFDSGMMGHGQMWSRMFMQEGEFPYHCDPHPWMTGSVSVMPSDGGAPSTHQVRIVEPTDTQAWAFEPASPTIRAGDTVEWTNEGDIDHTVTSLDEAAEPAQDTPLLPAAFVSVALLAVAAIRRR